MKNIKTFCSLGIFQLNKKTNLRKVTEIRRKIQGEKLLPSAAAVTS